jgi:TP901 family phage tail tape measure protein
MADVNAKLGVSLDTSDALNQLKDLQRRISQFHSSIATTSDAAAQSQRKLQANFVNSINAIGGFAAELRTVRTTAENFTNSLEKNKFSMGEYFRYAAGSTKTFGRFFDSEMATIEKTAVERVKTIQTQYVKMGRDASGAMQSIAIRPTVLNMQDLGTQTQITAQKQALFNQLVNQGSTNLLNFGKNTQWAGRQLMVGFTLPLITLGTAASRTFMEMEAQVIKFRKVYGDLFTPTAERDQALEQVKELASSFTQYGIAVETTIGLAAEAAAAGFQGVDLQNQTNAATKLSILGQLEQQKALETTISLQNAFQMSSADLATTIDFLNAVENQTVVSLDDITTAIPKVAPVIQSLGGDVKDLAFFLAAMKEGGVNASEGANALKSGLASLINPTEKAAEFLGNLGININQIVSQNEGDLKGTVLDFANALDTLKPLERAKAIEQLFGKFQFARLSTLFENVIRDGNQASRVLDLASASIDDLASMSEKELGMTAESAMNKFLKTVEDLKAALAPVGEVFLQVVTPFLDGLGKIVEGFNNLPSDFKKIITTIIALVGGLGPVVLMTFGLLANGVANAIKFINLLRNGFLRLTGQSTILGETTEYLTNEQLQAAAAAASLDQAHQKLTQRFTVEASVVKQLRDAYEQALVSGNKFAAMNPGMMRAGAPKKFSTGGFVSGSGSGDVIPAMLTPGEFVIKKDVAQKTLPFLEMLNAGKIPGFKLGGQVGPVTSAEGSQYGSVFAHIGDALTMTVKDFADTLEKAGKSIPNDVQKYLKAGLGDTKLRAYGGLGFETNQKFNDAMKPGGRGVTPSAFLEDFDSRGLEKWSASLKVAGLKMEDVNSDLVELNDGIRQQVAQASELNESFIVTDAAIDEFAQKTLKDLKAKGSQLALGFERAKNTVTEVRGMPRQSELQAAGFTPVEGRAGYSISPDKDLTVKAGRGIKKGGGSKSKTPGGVYGLMLSDFETALAKEAQTQSPSKRTQDIAKDTVDGYVIGLEQGIEKVKKVPRRATSGGISKFDERSQSYMIEEKFAKQEAARQTAIARVTSIAVGRIDDLSGKAMGLSFALSSVAGIASMFGGAVGEAAGVIFGLSNALFGLASVTQLLIKTKMAERAVSALTTAGGIGGLAAGGVKGARGVAKGLPAATGAISKLGNIFTGLSQVVGGALGGFARLIPVIGIAVTAFAAFQFFSGIIEEQRKKIEGLGETARLSGEKISGLAEKFGVAIKQSGISGRFNSTTQGTSAAQQSEAINLAQDEQFTTDFATQISAIQNADKGMAEAVLKSLTLQLKTAGFGTEAVETILLGITEAANRTDLNLSFAKIDLNTPQGKAQITQGAIEQAQLFADSFESGVSRNTSGKVYRITDELKTQAGVVAATFANTFEALDVGLQGGAFTADEFNSKLNAATDSLQGLGSEALSFVLPGLKKSLGIEEQLEGIKSYYNQILLIKAATAGVDVSRFTDAIAQGEAPGASAKQQATAGRARMQLIKLTEDSAEATLRLAEANRLATKAAQEKLDVEQAPGKIQEQIDGLKDQKAAYDNLVLSGIPAAEAIKLVGDESIVAAAKSGVLTGDTLQLVKDLIAARNEMDKLTTSGGSGKKTVFQEAVEDLTNQRKEITQTNIAYAKLRKTGMDVSTAFKVAKDPIMAAALASTKVGSKQWKTLIGLIKQVRLEAIKTAQGQAEAFDEMKSKAEDYFSILETGVNLKYADQIRDAQKAVDNTTKAIAEVQKEIDGINETISDKQRDIEIEITRPIEDLQEQISDIEREIELQFDRPIAALQEESSDLANDLTLIDKAAEKINEKYDMQAKALEQVSKVNQQIINQQKSQISLADALSQGDISAAAQLMQDMRGQSAEAAAGSIEDSLTAARNAEVAGLTGPGGLTRAQIEERQFQIGQQIFQLEEGREAQQARILVIQDKIYGLEELRETRTRSIRDLEDQVYKITESRLEPLQSQLDKEQGILDKITAQRDTEIDAIDKQRQKWELAQNAIDKSKVKAGEFNDIIRIGRGLISNAAATWQSIKSKAITLTITEVRKSVSPTSVQTKMYGGKIAKMATGGFVPGIGMTDKVPALLTPGEFVVNKAASNAFGPLLSSLNESKYPSMLSDAFAMPTYNVSNVASSSFPATTVANTSTTNNESVYNYNLSVNVNGSNVDANTIANTVMAKLQKIDSQRIRRQVAR